MLKNMYQNTHVRDPVPVSRRAYALQKTLDIIKHTEQINPFTLLGAALRLNI